MLTVPADMLKTVMADGSPFRFPLGDRAGFTNHTWEMGIFAGEYGAATLVSGYAALSFHSQLQLEAARLVIGAGAPRERRALRGRRRLRVHAHRGEERDGQTRM